MVDRGITRPLLSDSWARWRRAQEHWSSAQAMIAAFRDSPDACNRSYEERIEGSAGAIEVRLTKMGGLDQMLPLVISDAIHNLRAALENAATACYRIRGKKLDPRDVCFPVVHDPRDWAATSAKALPGVPAVIVDAVKQAQPFIPTGTIPTRGAPLHPLSTLNRIARIDRHQRLHIVAAVNTRGRLVISAENVDFGPMEPGSGTMQDGALLATQPFRIVDPSKPHRARVLLHQMDIIISLEGFGPPLALIFDWLLEETDRTLRRIEGAAASVR